MTCIVKKHHLKVLFKEMQFVAFFIFHMEKTRMQVKNDLRCLRQIKTAESKSGFRLQLLYYARIVAKHWNQAPGCQRETP